jgi:hypothetical protein
MSASATPSTPAAQGRCAQIISLSAFRRARAVRALERAVAQLPQRGPHWSQLFETLRGPDA